MKIGISIFAFLFFNSLSIGQTPEELFKQGNVAYNLGKYQEAIDSYHKIIDNQLHSPEVYFNIANSYYRKGEVAQSIFYFEKVRQLQPNNKKAATNLSFAENMSLDSIDPLPETFFSKIKKDVFFSFSLTTWKTILKIFSWVLAFLFGLYFWNSKPIWKRIYFSTFWVVMILFVSIFSLTYSESSRTEKEKSAIIFESKINIWEEPNKRSEVLFVLHEGTKVLVQDKLDGWNKIKIANGSEGWISSSAIKLLD